MSPWDPSRGAIGPVRDVARGRSGRSDRDKLAPKAVIGRVSLYLRQLEVFHERGLTTISSSSLGTTLGVNDAQVRKDLAYFGQFGCPGIGYRIDELIIVLRGILGIDREWSMALIGLGNLGQALLKYRGFRGRGFRIVALFDNDPVKIGRTFESMTVESLSSLAAATRARDIEMAILCVPADAAQLAADIVVASGITGILNFAPTPLVLPDKVNVVGVDLSVQLEHLAYKVHNSQIAGSIAPEDSASSFRPTSTSLE